MGPKEFIVVDKTLEERGQVYGSYEEGLKFRRAVEVLINDKYKHDHNIDMSEEHLFLFNDVLGKLSRLASSPLHKDSWHDLAGYAILVENLIEDEKPNLFTIDTL